ncbi:MAG: AraC family transcriptional regulator [Alistipes sp.]|nr:AraC family transcriptional regulator [Alistipes sp.]MBQ8916621.1 AraC family transcriptional regulator [Alistipes sp.]
MAPKQQSLNDRNFDKVPISRIRRDLSDVSYLSDDLAFMAINAATNPTERAPKSIDGFSALIMLTGEATVQVNMKSYTIKPNTIVFFNPNSVIRSERVSANASGYFLAYSKSFINDIQVGLSASLPIYMHFRISPVLRVTQEDVTEILQVFRLMKRVLHGEEMRYRNEIVRSLFTTAFYIIAEINKREEAQRPKQGRCEVIFDEFMLLLEKHCRRERNVGFYAKLLNLTPKYFSTAIKEVSGKTAARWIDEAVILEAKTLLKYSGMSIQEIAYELNFSTQSFFGKYFKQHTGDSPSRYKHK